MVYVIFSNQSNPHKNCVELGSIESARQYLGNLGYKKAQENPEVWQKQRGAFLVEASFSESAPREFRPSQITKVAPAAVEAAKTR